jgi:hypothetical protein
MLTIAGGAGLLLGCACTGGRRNAPPPTFTPAPTATSARPAATQPAHPVVARDCLRSLSSYRFSGTFSLTPAARAQAAPASGQPAFAGSIANLLSNVAFQGSAQAPDRYQARVTFGGSGVQPLDVVRIASQNYSRFGDNAWKQGDQIQGFGGISQFDPESICERTLAFVDSGGQAPAHESIDGVAVLRYDVTGAQLRALGGGRPATGIQTPTPAAEAAQATVWTAEKGGYPLRFHIKTETAAGAIDLLVNISDVNGRDIRISAPSPQP